MYYVMFNDKKTLIIANAVNAVVNEGRGYVKFYDHHGELISLFNLSDIKGFYQGN